MKRNEMEPETQVFVLRFVRGASGGWRGHIEHVPSGRRLPVTGLQQLQALISEYLQGEPNPDEVGE